MTKRFFVLLCAAILAWVVTDTARAATAPSSSSWDPVDTPPTVHDVAFAAARARATHCRTSSCKAIILIHELMAIEFYEIGNENGRNEYAGDRPQVAGRRLHRTLLDHPNLFAPVCATGAKLLSRVHFDLGEFFVPVTLLVNSVDMDLRGHGHCARDLVAALPRDPWNDQIRINARDLCVNGDEGQRRPKAVCAVLVEGVHEKP